MLPLEGLGAVLDELVGDGVTANSRRRQPGGMDGFEDRAPGPTAAVLDSQSVKTTSRGGDRGYDAGKKNLRAQAACAG